MPEVLTPHHLPKVFDPSRILADQQLRQIFDGADDAARVPFEGRFPPAKQSWLVGDNFDEHPVPHASMANECFDTSDFHRDGLFLFFASHSAFRMNPLNVFGAWLSFIHWYDGLPVGRLGQYDGLPVGRDNTTDWKSSVRCNQLGRASLTSLSEIVARSVWAKDVGQKMEWQKISLGRW